MSQKVDPALVQKLCEQASKESDGEKLLELIKKINSELDKDLRHSDAREQSRKSA